MSMKGAEAETYIGPVCDIIGARADGEELT